MARRTRCSYAGCVYHVLNRAVGRATLFRKPADYAAFEKILREAWERPAMRLLAYVMRSVQRGVPYGDEAWQQRTAAALGLASSLRPPGRQRQPAKNET